MKNLLFIAVLLASSVFAEEKWDYKREVVFDSSHDPSLVFLKDGRKVEVFYGGTKPIDISDWKTGRTLLIAYKPADGVVLFDALSGKKLPIVGQFGEHPIDLLMNSCLNDDATMNDINGCYGQARNRWDKELNLSYSRLLAVLDAKGKEDLIHAQRAWIRFRDLQLTAIVSVYSEGGQMAGYVVSQMRMTLTKEQALRLGAMVNR